MTLQGIAVTKGARAAIEAAGGSVGAVAAHVKLKKLIKKPVDAATKK